MYYSTSMPGYGVFWKQGKGILMSIEEGTAEATEVVETPVETTETVEVTETPTETPAETV